MRVVELVLPGPDRGSFRWASLQEGAREVLVTLLATLAFGLGWAAIEAGRANAALARDGIPTATAAEVAWTGPGGGGEETGYPRSRMERR
jgi:hypothetical protein